MTRVFLDANVLFSAAYREVSGLAKLWTLADMELITSAYAVQEATANLDEPIQKARLVTLLKGVTIRPYVGDLRLPASVNLPEKDMPILQAAVDAKADILVTGDVAHFGRHYGKAICGTTVMSPADLLRRMKG